MIARSASCCHRLAHRKMTLPLHGLFAMLLLAAGLGACSAAAQTATPNQASFDLGSVNVGSAGLPATVTFTFTAGGSIAAPEVLTQGAPNLDYTDAGAGTCTTNGTAHVYNAGDTCTVNVTFSPKSAGSRLGAVVLSDNSTPAIPVATAYLQGSGAGPQTAFIHNSVPNALPYFSNPPSFVPYGAAVDGADNLFFTGSSPLFELPAASGYAHLKTLQNVGPYTFGPALAVDGAGNIFTFAGGEIAEVLAVGGYTTVKAHASGFSFPHAIALDGAGNVFVTDENGIYEVPVETGYATVVTLPPVPDTDATGLAVDAAGNVFFTNCRYTIVCGGEVEELTAASNYTQTNVIATGPGFWDFLAVDGSGNVFATDIQLGTVTVISTAGGANIATLAYQFPGYSYLDGPRLLDIAVDSNNRNLFLIFNYAIDEMDLGDPPSLTFAPTAWNLLNEYAPHIIPEQTVTVQNVGNQPLDITNLAYPPDFPEALGVTRDCTPSTTVVAGAGCTLSIDFWPLATSATGANTPLSESVSLTNNNLNVDGTVQSVSLSGTERASYTPPVITSPTPYSAMSGANATFTWSPGIGVTQYRFTLGSAWGASDIYNGSQTTATSAAVTGIPTVGGVIFATLYYYQPLPNGALQHVYAQYAESAAPSFIAPGPGVTLTGNSTTISWNPGSATLFRLRVGTGAGASDVYNGSSSTATSVTLTNLPDYGGTLFADLNYYVNGAWRGAVETNFITPGTPVLPSMTTPAPGSILTTSSATFTWDPGHGSNLFRLRLGSTLGADDIFNGTPTEGNSALATGIPTTGVRIYARLYYSVNARSHFIDYIYTAPTTSTLP